MSQKLKNSNQISLLESDYLYVKQSQILNSGNGLFTAITIYKDEIIAKYRGRILSESVAKEKAKNGEDIYFISLLDGSIMDSKYSRCFAKFANDAVGFSKSEFKNNSKIAFDDDRNICLVATKNIKSENEIFCSYGKRYWTKHGLGKQ